MNVLLLREMHIHDILQTMKSKNILPVACIRSGMRINPQICLEKLKIFAQLWLQNAEMRTSAMMRYIFWYVYTENPSSWIRQWWLLICSPR